MVSGDLISPVKSITPIHPVSGRYRRSSIRSVQAVSQRIEHVKEQMRLGKRLATERLKSIDAQVRAHEQAHVALLNGYAQGGPNYIYVLGPDGQLYAVGGSVDVDLRPIPGNPEATIRKARILRRASFGPTQPSAQDFRVAAAAYRMEMEAKRELAREEEKLSQETLTKSGKYIDIYA